MANTLVGAEKCQPRPLWLESVNASSFSSGQCFPEFIAGLEAVAATGCWPRLCQGARFTLGAERRPKTVALSAAPGRRYSRARRRAKIPSCVSSGLALLDWLGRLSGIVRIKWPAGFEHTVNQVQQFAHAGTHNRHLGFAAFCQPFGKGVDDRVVAHGHNRRKVQDMAQLTGALLGQPRLAMDTGARLALARVEPGLGDQLPGAGIGAEVKLAHQRRGRRRADPGDGIHQRDLLLQLGLRRQVLGHANCSSRTATTACKEATTCGSSSPSLSRLASCWRMSSRLSRRRTRARNARRARSGGVQGSGCWRRQNSANSQPSVWSVLVRTRVAWPKAFSRAGLITLTV